MTIDSTNPLLKINGKQVDYEPNSFKHQKGKPTRNGFPDTGFGIHVTEDLTTAIAMVSFDLRSSSTNEELFNSWVDEGKKNGIIFSRGNLNSNVTSAFVEDPNIEIENGSDSVFTVMFKGNQVVE